MEYLRVGDIEVRFPPAVTETPLPQVPHATRGVRMGDEPAPVVPKDPYDRLFPGGRPQFKHSEPAEVNG